MCTHKNEQTNSVTWAIETSLKVWHVSWCGRWLKPEKHSFEVKELTTEKEYISRTRQQISTVDYAKENQGVVIWKYTEIVLKTKRRDESS